MYHSQVLDMMGLGKDMLRLTVEEVSMVIKKPSIQRWADNYKTCLHQLKERLVLENCENVIQ